MPAQTLAAREHAAALVATVEAAVRGKLKFSLSQAGTLSRTQPAWKATCLEAAEAISIDLDNVLEWSHVDR